MPPPPNSHPQHELIDIHVHPSLKTFLFNKNIAEWHASPKFWWPLTLRSDLPKLRQGGVNVFLSSVYLPEKKILDDCIFTRIPTWFSPKLRQAMRGSPFEESVKVLDDYEERVNHALVGGVQVAQVAHSLSEMEAVLSTGKIAVIHSIEGGHTLEGKKENVRKFYEKGVCLITLGHFYENELVGTVDAIPDSYKILCCFRSPHDLNIGLTAAGKEVVEEMLDVGILVDLTHSTPKARAEVYAVNDDKRPLVFSHVGVQKYYDHPMNPTNQEIEIIAKSGGIIGVIFFNYWLCGIAEKKNGLNLIIKTIKHIRDVGGIDTVAVGTDFDGFTDPPDDLKDPSLMQKLTRRLEHEGFSDDEIRKILGGNARRVLQKGWGSI